MDRHLESLKDLAQDIRRAVKTPDVGRHVLTNYLVKIASLEGELQRLKRDILSIDDYEERKERASWIEHLLFEARETNLASRKRKGKRLQAIHSECG